MSHNLAHGFAQRLGCEKLQAELATVTSERDELQRRIQQVKQKAKDGLNASTKW